MKFVEFTKKQKRSQIKSRNHEEAKIQKLRNATQTYYCDVSRWPIFGTEPQPLCLKHAQVTQEHTEQPTT